MKRIKRVARIIAFILLIVLASIGVGLSGGIPIPMSNKRKDSQKENIEMLENHENESDDEKN